MINGMDASTVAVPSERPVELRAAVRFPLVVPIIITTDAGDLPAVTENISMPAEAMGTPTDVVLRCTGRVVRCKPDIKTTHVAAVIDEYTFSQ